jgi:hypothetical protein
MEWVIRFSRAAMMGLAWAGAWVPVGAVAARLMVSELDPEHIGGPLYAGFLCGTVFSGLAGIASDRRRLYDLTPFGAAVWGAAGGLFTGMAPFVLGEGHMGNQDAAWASAIVAISSVAAAIAAGRGLLGPLSSFKAAILAAVVSGVPAGVLPWIVGNQNTSQRFLPVAVMAVLSVLSALSAFVSVLVARWARGHDSEASAPSL